MTLALLLVASTVLVACDLNPPTPTPRLGSPTASASPSPSSAALPNLFPLPAGVIPPGGTAKLTAKTAHTAEPGKPYPFTLGHCGVGSPIDFDGSLWDVLGAQDGNDHQVPEEQLGDLVNASSGTMTLVGAENALFRTTSSVVVGLKRHGGAKNYPACA